MSFPRTCLFGAHHSSKSRNSTDSINHGKGAHTLHRSTIQIFSCGGTIDKVYFDAQSEYEVGTPQIDTIFQDAGVRLNCEIESLMRKDSLDMTDADRALVRQRIAEVRHVRVLVTHGTDTMTHTAQQLRGITDKVVVFTGSITPARFRATDAALNIGCALGALQCASPGVYIAMHGQVFDAFRVRKNREKQRFEYVDEGE